MERNCLIEIGVEELPASYIAPALEQLRSEVERGLEAQGVSHGLVLPMGTPRRLGLFVAGLPEKQDDRVETITGPPESAAYDAKGLPTKAAQGFATKQGVEIGDLRVEDTERGRYIAVEKKIEGRATGELLVDLLGGIIPRLGFPKTMTWGRGSLRFARPMRWLVALLDGEVLPLEVEGIKAGRKSCAHRFFGDKREFDIDKADLNGYRDTLRKNHIIVDSLERTETVRKQVEEAITGNGAKTVISDALVGVVTNLVEWPTAMVGKFDDAFLEVPREVLETAMIHHQRYFPVESDKGQLQSRFVFVSNGNSNHTDQIVAGNERVLRARLADAQFFYREDRKRSMEEHSKGLATVTWQEQLGSYAAKAERMKALGDKVGKALGLDDEAIGRVCKAACLCKADLVTGMVGEFPELQGVMGRIYFRAEGGDVEVARAIEEHYQPRAAGGALPSTTTGALLSLIDKIDSIVGCFRVGLAPTGSQDPYALRRQALGVIRILREHGEWTLPLTGLIASAAEGFGDLGETCNDETLEFIKQRVRNLLIEEGNRSEVVDAIFVTADDEIRSLCAKVQALSEIVDQPDFREIAHAAKRVLNILRQAEAKLERSEFTRPAGATATEDAERGLADALPQIQSKVASCWSKGDHLGAFHALATLRPQVDAFFDQVRVMDVEEAQRDFRLALLAEFRALFADIADISRIAIERDS